MKVKIRQVVLDQNGNQVMQEIKPYQMEINYECVVSIDGSTSNSGIAILRKQDGALLYCMSVARENGEEPIRYKVNIKNLIVQMLRKFKNIGYIYYEEPIIEYAVAVPNLMMLRTLVGELKIENEPEFNHIGNSEVNNKKWKKAFVSPDKLPADSEGQKRMVRNKLIGYIPALSEVTQDEIDAIAMGFAAITKTLDGYSENELESKKKAKPFQYNVEFVGAESEESAFEDFLNSFKVPKSVLDNGTKIVDLGPRASFDKTVYTQMENEDRLLVLKFKSDKHGDIILKHRIGSLAAIYDDLYAFVWRKSRKK